MTNDRGVVFMNGGNYSTSTNFVYDASGNVGVGNTNPASKLDVSGEIKVGSTNQSCTSTNSGSLRWYAAGTVIQVCDGSSWKSIATIGSGSATQTPAAPSGSGYFVMSSGTYNGNLGSMSGANNICLNELTNNDWMGKSTAQANGQLVAGKVFAFLCYDNNSANCHNTIPLTNYYFAVAGSPSVGGSYFTTDSDGRGPGNNYNWAAANYFGGNFTYSSGRGVNYSSVWSLAGIGGGAGNNNCQYYTSSSSSYDRGGGVGTSNSINESRWQNAYVSCNVPLHLICFVNP